ncbi:hypothetical protein [Neobacillus niacini]
MTIDVPKVQAKALIEAMRDHGRTKSAGEGSHRRDERPWTYQNC